MKSASLCFIEENAYDVFTELTQGHGEGTEENRKTTPGCPGHVRDFLLRL